MTKKHIFDLEHKDEFIDEMDHFHDSRMTVTKIEEKSITFKFECIDNNEIHYVKLNLEYELKDNYAIYNYYFKRHGKLGGMLEDDDYPNDLKNVDYTFDEFLYTVSCLYLHVYDEKNRKRGRSLQKIIRFYLVNSVEIR